MYNTIMSMSDLVYANLLLSLALAPALTTIYVMPMLIASERRHKHVNAIVVFNISTGWTFFGWVISFVWALAEEKEVK
jgi:Superinfection immunity protein